MKKKKKKKTWADCFQKKKTIGWETVGQRHLNQCRERLGCLDKTENSCQKNQYLNRFHDQSVGWDKEAIRLDLLESDQPFVS
jgi:hypothetical protein